MHSLYGWHVIQALSPVTLATTTPLVQAKTKIRRQRKNNAMTTWIDDVKKQFASNVACAPGHAPSHSH